MSGVDRWVARLLRTRWVVRAPIGLYRMRLGWLLGPRLLMLEHRGRTTGLRRFVVLEVVDQPFRHGWIVVPGFGDRSQWLRNLRHEPHCRVWSLSRRPVPAIAHDLPAAQAEKTLRLYATRHPFAWRRLRPVLEATLGGHIDPIDPGVFVVMLEGARP
jgi:deazaflavin-dependent oxidoreductase (nitroreductase family)